MLPLPSPDSTVVVTGASSGIGAQFARSLAARGYNLTLVARRENLLAEQAKSLSEEFDVTVDVAACDLSNQGKREALVAKLHTGRRVIALVNNAGFGSVGYFAKLPLDRQREQIVVNIDALVSLTYELLPTMLEARSGSILNVASTAAFQPVPTMATYAATKAFVLSFSQALGTELEGTGVSITCLCPGPTRGTEFGYTAGASEPETESESESSPSAGAKLLKTAEAVAEEGVNGMVDGKQVVIPGVLNKVGAVGSSVVPRQFLLPMLRRIGGNRIAGSTTRS